MSETAETLGQRLKAERERRGLSTQKAADELHLDGWVIDALESGDYVRIGPAVYGKGHLKRYAGLLGMPAAEMLDVFDARATEPAPTPQMSTLRMPAAPAGGRALPWGAIAGCAAAVAIVVGLLWWRPWHARISASPPAVPIASNSVPDAASGSRASAPVASSAADSSSSVAGAPPDAGPTAAAGALVAEAPSAPAPGNGANAAGESGRARLRLSFSADSWVDVHDSFGRRLFAGKGRANTVRTIVGAAPLSVYLGFASGVQVQVNGHGVAIGRQFVNGDIAHFAAGADGVLRRDAHANAMGTAHPRG